MNFARLFSVAAILLVIGCSEKIRPTKPFAQTRVELQQVYEFEQKELDKAYTDRELAESRAADILFHQITIADGSTHVLSLKELESYIRALPDDKIDAARASLANERTKLRSLDDALAEQRSRVAKAKAELDAVRQ